MNRPLHRLRCLIGGHSWYRLPTVQREFPKAGWAQVIQCRRCLKERPGLRVPR